MLYLKVYVLAQNILLILVIKLSISRLTLSWRNFNNILQIILLASSIFGLVVYLGPIFLWNSENSDKYDFKKSNFEINEVEIPWL